MNTSQVTERNGNEGNEESNQGSVAPLVAGIVAAIGGMTAYVAPYLVPVAEYGAKYALTVGINPALMPMIVVGGGVAYGGYRIIQHYRNRKNTTDTKKEEAKKIALIKKQLVEADENQPINLDLREMSSHYLKSLNEMLVELYPARTSKKTKIQSISIDAEKNTDDQLISLIKGKIGFFGTEELEIRNGRCPNLLPILSLKIKQGAFLQVKKLNLSYVAITPDKLKSLKEIGHILSLENLVLSGNPLGTEYNITHGPILHDFFRNAYRNFPKLKSLELKEVRLHDEELVFLKQLMNSMTLLEKLDISENGWTTKAVHQLVSGVEFQTNLSLSDFKTGHDDNVEIKAALNKRNQNREKFLAVLKEVMNLKENDSLGDVPLVVLNYLKAKNKTVHDALREFISSSVPSKFADLYIKHHMMKWEQWAQKLYQSQNDKDISKDEFMNIVRQTDNVQLPSIKEMYVDEKLAVLTEVRTNNNIVFELNAANAKFNIKGTDCVKKITKALYELEKKADLPILERIAINNADLTSEEWIKLLNAGIGGYHTKVLELKNNQLTDQVFYHLSEVANDSFMDVKTLDLSGNKLTAQGLKYLVLFCNRAGVENLIISDNPLLSGQAQNKKVLSDFFENLHRTIPTLKSFAINDIGLNSKTITWIKPILTELSLIESIEFSQKSIKRPQSIYKMLEDPAFQGNLNLTQVKTGFDSVERVMDALDLKKMNNGIFSRRIAEHELDLPTTCVLINRFMRNRTHPELPPNIRTLLKKKGQSKTDTWSQLLVFADKLKFRGIVEKVDASSFADLKANEPSDYELLIFSKLEHLKSADDNSETDFKINEENSSILLRKVDILQKLEEALVFLDQQNKNLIIKTLSLNNLDIDRNEFENLIVAGLGQYKTQTLELRHNHLTDDFLISFAKLDKTIFNHLKCLDLSHNHITQNGLKYISSFCAEVGVEKLILAHNPIVSDDTQVFMDLLNFAEFAHCKIPTLKELDLQDIGLNDRNLNLLNPLLIQPSLLERVNIQQENVRKYKSIENIVKRKDFQANIVLTYLETGKNNLKRLKNHFSKKMEMRSKLVDTLQGEEHEVPLICAMLSQLMKDPADVRWPKEFNVCLNKAKQVTSSTMLATPREKLIFMARRLRYFRDLAVIHHSETQLSNVVTLEEYLALKQNKLYEYWIKNNNTQINEEYLQQALTRYENMCITNQEFEALMFYQGKIDDNNLKIYWGTDDSIRLVNETTAKQFVLQRYARALKIEPESPEQWKIGDYHKLIINNRGIVFVYHVNSGQGFTIVGPHTINFRGTHALNQTFDPKKFEYVSEFSDLLVRAAVPRRSTPQYDLVQQRQQQHQMNQREANQEVLDPQRARNH